MMWTRLSLSASKCFSPTGWRTAKASGSVLTDCAGGLIPRSRTWQFVKGVAVTAAGIGLLAGGYWTVRYVRGADQRALEVVAAESSLRASARDRQDCRGHTSGAGRTLGNPQLVDLAVSKLRALVVGQADATDKGRTIRKLAVEAIKTLRQNDLTRDFTGVDLKKVDLVDVNLSRAVMKRLSLEGGFLIRTDFAAADLSGSTSPPRG